MKVHLLRSDDCSGHLRIASVDTRISNHDMLGKILKSLAFLLQSPEVIQTIQEDDGITIVWDEAPADPKMKTYDFTK